MVLSCGKGVFAQLTLNSYCQAMLTDAETGLVASQPNSYDYTYAERNTNVITNALKRLGKNQDLLLPNGFYYVNTVLIAKTISGCTISGAGQGVTTLCRVGFSWDNNLQGDCPLRMEVFQTDNVNGLEIKDITLDGNSHHMAISGYGKWNTSTGTYSNGLPQFPTFITTDSFLASGKGVVTISLSQNITFDNVEFKNGFGWCVFLGKVNGFTMRNCIIDTGNLSTEFKGHFDPYPNNTVMHMHTSQDGLHMVNVSNALVEFNDIHSEDSGIAIELNPSWNWGGYDIVENVTIRNNYVTTASPVDPAKLMNDNDLIYGAGLANAWTGQSGVDIFYNENFDQTGTKFYKGSDFFRNIEIRENSFENVRQGVRCGFFIGATFGHYKHRIYNLTIRDHEPTFMAGRDKNKPAGIRNVTRNIYSNSWNKSGGAGIAVRYTDSLKVTNNLIDNCSGGLGISIENVTRFELTGNRIDKISGKQLGDLGSIWDGGEGIRVFNHSTLVNDPNLKNGYFDAVNFVIKDNYIGQVETNRIAVISTMNGIVRAEENYDLTGTSLCTATPRIYKLNTLNIDWGVCSTNSDFLYESSDFTLSPGSIVAGNLIVRQKRNSDKDYKVVLYNACGISLFSSTFANGDVLVPMWYLPSSIYFLSLQNNSGIVQRMKIVKKNNVLIRFL